MTVATHPTVTARGGAKATLGRVFTSETVKLSSLPAYMVSFVSALIVLVGFGLMSAWARIIQSNELPQIGALEPGAVLAGLQGAQLLVALTAAVFATSEYAQQTVQPTYLATPLRVPVLAAKAGLMAVVGLVVGAVGGVLALAGASLVLADTNLAFGISVDFGAQLVFGAGLYLAAVAVLGLAVGTIVRHTVAGLLSMVGLLGIAPLVLGAVPVEWIRNATAYLPSTAGLLILQQDGVSSVLGPWSGLGVTDLWALAALIGAAVFVRLTDA
ncbi:hypothetical protein FGL91_16830 [Microbacterium sp. CBA3102]|uniref:hypothetical protein n=1 Tax=Microbacterium sp. CBA3102 TaxID=2603598 RepID=UPI0011BBC139|nr:hypothetical protein [Microbacterium sp. CBA3102]QEA30066.1 hypothetical protein FGL91_16830 [Microbacterium sp. CBA3102]